MFRAAALPFLLIVLAACGGANTPVPTPPVIVQLIEFWQPVNSTLAPGETQGWLFAGNSGDAISLRA
ncbi:MAG: hypothetical protein K8I30_19145, partial [Anaerolineae bacterium]|nr:hypothetical protein [Anaerolineae bacterium]